MRHSSSNTVRISVKPRRRDQASARTALLMLVLFLTGMGVGALWVYRSAQKPAIPGEDVERTLADSTRAVLENLKSPVEIQFYSLFGDGSSSGDLSEFAGRVKSLLAAFQQEAGGKIKVKPYDSWTDANTKSASAAGVVPFTVGGDAAYLGLIAVQDGRKETLPQLLPEWEQALEFDLARAISRVASSPLPPDSAADMALVERATQDVQRSIPNLATVSLEDGKRILREAALKEYKAAVAEMDNEIKEAQQRLLKAEAANSDSDRQAALEGLRQLQSNHTEKLNQIATRSQAQIEALQRLKRQ